MQLQRTASQRGNGDVRWMKCSHFKNAANLSSHMFAVLLNVVKRVFLWNCSSLPFSCWISQCFCFCNLLCSETGLIRKVVGQQSCLLLQPDLAPVLVGFYDINLSVHLFHVLECIDYKGELDRVTPPTFHSKQEVPTGTQKPKSHRVLL